MPKYDRIDPAEFQALRDEIEQLRTHKVAIEQQKIEVEQLSAERRATIEISNEKVRPCDSDPPVADKASLSRSPTSRRRCRIRRRLVSETLVSSGIGWEGPIVK